VQAFEAVHLGGRTAGRPALREGGAYLITGGLGGLGLHLAEWLARSARARLTLLGRSAFPPRHEWSSWLGAHAGSHGVSRTIRKLQSLEELGAEVLVLNADVADPVQMRAAFARARERFGRILGVIHAAGVAGGGMMQLRTAEQAARVLAPKVRGTLVLRDLLRESPPEFFVLCSSIEAVRGSFGQVEYCAANCFLDAFAYQHTYRDGVPTVSVNWDRWQDTGMAAEARSPFDRAEGEPGAQGPSHPLLGARETITPHERTFRTELDPGRHWVLDEHRIFEGTGVVPGTAFLEMARAAFAGDAAGPVDFSGVLFLRPLCVADGETREVRTVLRSEGEAMTFAIQSRRPVVDEAPEWEDHAVGRIGAGTPEPVPIRDMNARIGRLGLAEVEVTQAHRDMIRRRGMGPRWDNVRRVYAGATEAVALVELAEPFAADLEELALHPALLDTATGFANGHLGGEGLYLPLSYDRMRVHGPLPARLYSHVRSGERDGAAGEMLRLDVTLVDERGCELVRVEGITFRRVGPEGPADGRATPRAAAPPRRAARDEPISLWRRIAGGGIQPQDGVEALGRILASGLVPQVLVSPKEPGMLLEDTVPPGEPGDAAILEQIGDLARARPGPAHTRPELATAYEAPREGLESRMAAIWEGLLGVERVGRNDNFFALGGDSVVAIQVIARARQAGVELTPQQLFQHQTVGELVEALGEASAGHGQSNGIPRRAAEGDTPGAFALAGLDEHGMADLARLVEALDDPGVGE
jgi:NAD(P)-dependent dehydrogenase (short-subunit alcohol dehydrogenase family)